MPTRQANRIYERWWEPLLAIPPSKTSAEYDRLRHLWIDPTRMRQGLQEFYNSGWETHITAVLWENFTTLPVETWLPQLAGRSRLRIGAAELHVANWSYGWLWKEGSQRKIMDVVVAYRSKSEEEGIIIIEAKSPWVRPQSKKDFNPKYYLDIPTFKSFPKRSLIYLLGQSFITGAQSLIKPSDHDIGFLSWEDLAGIQIAAARKLDVPKAIRGFVAGALQNQFLGFGIEPTVLAADYLTSEPSRKEIDKMQNSDRYASADRQSQRWRCPERS